jgi:hypothetical protein
MKNKGMYLLYGLLTFGLLYFWHPEIVNYHEQNQLFLWTADYFTNSLALPGGLADWLSEGMVQFGYVPWLGALVLSLLFTLLALATNVWIGVLFWVSLLDVYNLISFPVACLLAVAAARAVSDIRWIPLSADLLLWPALYWLIGPMAVLYASLRMIRQYQAGTLRAWHPLLYLIYILAIVLILHRMFFPQWPLASAFLGLNYCRAPMLHPSCHWLLPLTVMLAALVRLPRKESRWATLKESSLAFRLFLIASAVTSLGVLWPLKDYPAESYEVLRQDMLVRQERWDEVIARAEKHQPQTNMSSEYVNLALGMKGQLAARMFQFYQSGPDALIMRSMSDNMSNMASAEAFYRLGMVNSALRYYSDLQESIINRRKSGRLERRIAVCQLANGRTAVACKHLDLLRHSLFYRAEAEELIQNGTNADVQRLQRLRYRTDMLYDYPEIDKMLGLLFVNNPENRLALEYFLGQLLLKGDVQNFMAHLSWAQQYGGYAAMPAGYQDALRTIQSHGQAAGTLYGPYVKKMLSANSSQKP